MDQDPKSVPQTALAAEAGSAAAGPGLRRELTLFDAVAIVVGTVIGSGIFLIPSSIANDLSSLGAVLAVWLLGGVLTIFGALSLAELGSMFPSTGGLCIYLRQAYGRFTAFLYAWGLLFMIHSGSIAALAVAFGLFAGQIVPLTGVQEKLISAALVALLTLINCWGIRGGKLTQNLIAAAKITGLAAIIVLLAVKGARPIRLSRLFAIPASGIPFTFAHFGIALVAVLFAYEGWHIVSFVAGEMKRPQTDLPRGLYYGTAFVALVYLAANLGYYHLLTLAQIRGTSALAAYAVGVVLGPAARIAISALVLISILGSLNGLILTGPRVYLAMAQERAFPALFGRIDARYRTPIFALVVQGAWSAVLAVSGTYQQLFTDVIFTAWTFYALAVAGVIVLRRRCPEQERSFRVPGYPWLSLLFCAAAAGVVLSTILERPLGALAGAALVLSGVPVYWYLTRRPRRASG